MQLFYKLLIVLVLLGLAGCAGTDANYGSAGGGGANHYAANLAPPKQIAILLPLQGPLSVPGHAIRNGFMDGYTQATNQGTSQATVKFYDSSQGDISTVYHQAVQEGADFVLGPLDKAQAQQVAQQSHPVTTMVLNYPQTGGARNLYQFGLSPVDEAQGAAAKAAEDGHRAIIIIAPQSPWGQNIAQAFAARWNSLGGTVVDQLSYTPQQDLNDSIKRLMHFNDAPLQASKESGNKGNKITAAEVRRNDFDSIFLLATPDTARQINPLLKFYYAGNVAIYSTSTVYSGIPSPLKDRDLDGIIFSDMPWVLGNGTISPHPQPNARLYALGLDSFSLTSKLSQVGSSPNSGLPGATGTLYLNNNQQIGRKLLWAKFSQGVPYVLGQGGAS